MKYVIGNWKSHKNTMDVLAWCHAIGNAKLQFKTSQLTAVLCPSFVHLSMIHTALPDLALGTQTLSPFPDGAYTGAVSGRMVQDFAQYALLGHVERRKYFGETDQIVGNQAQQALENELTPIIAVSSQNWSNQLAQLSTAQLKKIIVMYEPPEAISTQGQGHAADLESVKSAIQLIKSEYELKAVLYGGSVDSQNILTYLQEELIDGVVPGAASLDGDEYIKMVRQASLLK